MTFSADNLTLHIESGTYIDESVEFTVSVLNRVFSVEAKETVSAFFTRPSAPAYLVTTSDKLLVGETTQLTFHVSSVSEAVTWTLSVSDSDYPIVASGNSLVLNHSNWDSVTDSVIVTINAKSTTTNEVGLGTVALNAYHKPLVTYNSITPVSGNAGFTNFTTSCSASSPAYNTYTLTYRLDAIDIDNNVIEEVCACCDTVATLPFGTVKLLCTAYDAESGASQSAESAALSITPLDAAVVDDILDRSGSPSEKTDDFIEALGLISSLTTDDAVTVMVKLIDNSTVTNLGVDGVVSVTNSDILRSRVTAGQVTTLLKRYDHMVTGVDHAKMKDIIDKLVGFSVAVGDADITSAHTFLKNLAVRLGEYADSVIVSEASTVHVSGGQSKDGLMADVVDGQISISPSDTWSTHSVGF